MYNDLPPVDVNRDVVFLKNNPVVLPMLALVNGLIAVGAAYAGWMFATGQYEPAQGQLLATALGWLSLYAGAALLVATAGLTARMFTRRPALVIAPEGLSHPSVKNGPVPWRSITSVRLTMFRFVYRIEIGVDKAILEHLDLDWLGAIQRRAPWLLGSFAISQLPGALTVSAKSLQSTLEAYWKAHRHSKESVNV